jgi:hypothetical protein
MRPVNASLAIMGLILVATLEQATSAADAAAPVAWTRSYDAGYTDRSGAYAGGSEIMHLVPHKGKLYAAKG